jgi:hypothetical protein
MSNIANKNIGAFIKETNVDKERLDFYEVKMKSKEILELKFSLADKVGNLYFYEGDIRVQMDNLDIKGTIYNVRYRSNALANSYPVIVTSVDREKKEIHVSHKEAREMTKEELIDEIDAAIEKKEPLTVIAKVIKIQGKAGSSYAIVDLGGVGITGIIKMKDWSTVFTSDLRLVAKHGDIIKVVVKNRVLWNGKPGYSCSRGEALEVDPWSGIEEKLQKGTFVNVLCICKRDKNFFGKIEGIDEINAYCEYPDKEKNIEIVEGISYQGFVAAVSENNKLLRVKIFNRLK